MLTLISDYHNPQALLELDGDIKKLREEYESIMDPGPNPHKYNTDIQKEWLKKIRDRENFLISKYGGDISGNGVTVYTPSTFINWLTQEKGAKHVSYVHHCMVEFD